jgi:uncharacterized protein
VDLDKLYSLVGRAFGPGAQGGHGMDHATRVAKMARYIAEQEGYDSLEAEIAGLVHDMGRTVQKEDKGHGPAGVPLAATLLDDCTGYDAATKQRILDAVRDHSAFKAEGALTHIVQDADKLDGLGAIGIARAYLHRSRLPLYDPENLLPSEPAVDTTGQAHFLWLLEWVDMMETDTGRALAKSRGEFTADFMRQVAREAKLEDIST